MARAKPESRPDTTCPVFYKKDSSFVTYCLLRFRPSLLLRAPQDSYQLDLSCTTRLAGVVQKDVELRPSISRLQGLRPVEDRDKADHS